MRTLTINYGHGVDGDPHRKGIEVVNEYGESTQSVTIGEALEQLIALLAAEGISHRGYPMVTPEQWEAQRLARFARARARENNATPF